MVKYSEEDIRNDIIRVKNKIDKIPTQKEYGTYGKIAISLILSKKPWNVWLEELFTKTNHKVTGGNGMKVSNDDLLQNLLDLCEVIGRTPRQSELQIGKYFRAEYKRAFGSFSNALKQIGLTAKIQYNLTKEDLIFDLLRVYNELGKTPSFDEFDKLSKTVSNVTIANKFGSWNKALKEAGIPIIHNQKVSKEEVIDALHCWVEKHDNDLSCLEYWAIRKAGETGEFPYSANTVSSKFDKKPWEEIMKESGYEYETLNQFFSRGSYDGKDGGKYFSMLEKEIADFLLQLKTQKRISDYVYEKKVCEDRTWTCDFVVTKDNLEEIWIEADGMLSGRKNPYSSGQNEKIEYYKNNSFNYFIVSHKMNYLKVIDDIIFGTE